MVRRFITFACLLLVCAMAACQSGPPASSFASDTLSLPDRTNIIQNGDLRIGPLDMLRIRVFGVDELDGEYQVDAFGWMKMPLIGEVSAKGYTAFEFSHVLEERLSENYLQDPDVTVSILESLGEQITVEGSVNKPGMYPVPGQISLLQAVALSGGPSENANPKKVAIFREIEGKRQYAVFDLTAIRNDEMADPSVYGNDIIVVDGSETRQTYRDFLRSVPLFALFLAF